MKSRINTVLALIMAGTLTACGSAGAESTKEELKTEETVVEIVEEVAAPVEEAFSVEKQIYSDDHIDLTCKEIRGDGILFECNNKTPRDILLSFDTALDGILQSMWSDVTESTVMSGEKKEFMYYSQDIISNTEHETITIAGMGFVDGTEYMSFDVVDFDLGGVRNPDKLADGTVIYESDNMDMEFVGLFAQGLEFKISNKTEHAISFFVDEIMMNGDINGYGSAFTMPAHTEGVCRHYVTNYVENFNGDDIKSFTGRIAANLPEQGTVTLCELDYDNGNITSKQNANAPNMSDNNGETESATEDVTEAAVQEEKASVTQIAFEAVTTMTKADLTGEKGKWKYKGLLLTTEDCEWIDSSLNKMGTVEAGAIYRKVGYLLEGFDSKINNGKDYCDLVFGVAFESRDALIPYVENMKDFYSEEYPIISIMKKLNMISNVSGEFDFEYGKLGKYSVSISDTVACADELMISERMLGYTLAMLTEYAAEVQFDGNSCTINYEGFGE